MHGAGERSFVPRLEATRGVAAVLVALFHAAQAPTFRSAADQTLVTGRLGEGLWPLLNGHGAVIFFFVLSGFVLARSLAARPADWRAAAGPYAIARLFRLYPAVIATVLICAGAFFAGWGLPMVPAAAYEPGPLLGHMLLLNANIVGVMWSLQAEVLAAPLIFAAVLLLRRRGAAAVALLAAVLLALSYSKEWSRLVAFGSTSATGPLYCFLLGVLVQACAGPVAAALRPTTGCVLLVGWVALFFAARPVLGYGSHWSQVVEAIASCGIVGLIAYAPGGGLARPLDWRIVRFYGRISYSFYLLHPLTAIVLWRMPGPLTALAESGMPRPLAGLMVGLGSVLVATPLAWVSWRFVERPGIALGARLIRLCRMAAGDPAASRAAAGGAIRPALAEA